MRPDIQAGRQAGRKTADAKEGREGSPCVPPAFSRVDPVGLGATRLTRQDRWAPGCAENRPNPVRGMA